MNAQEQLLNIYGPPDHAYLTKYCEVWEVKKDFSWFPVSRFLVNKYFKAVLIKAYTALQAAGLHTEIKSFDGCYNDRNVRGSNKLSGHAYAVAVDHNAAQEGMQSIPAADITPEKRLGNWSAQFVATMKGAGLFYGGDFHTIHADGTERIDPMHFALLDI
jgi:hypothetical protein